MKVVIPMAGFGSRFIQAGYTDPKPLIMVDGKPMIEHVVNLFRSSNHLNGNLNDDSNDGSNCCDSTNLDDGKISFVFICNRDHLETTQMESILKRIQPDCQIYAIEPHKKGPVWTVSLCMDQIFASLGDMDEPVIVSYCDYGTGWDFSGFLADLRSRNLDGSVPSYRGFHPHMLGKDNYAFIKMDDSGLMSQIQEKKPFTDDRMSEYASNGTYYFGRGEYVVKYFQSLIDSKIELNGEYYISLVYNLMVADGLRIGVFEIEHMLQWGTPYDLSVYQMWSSYFRGRDSYSKKLSHPEGTTLILPLAGRGNRFAVQGYSVPKPLLDVDGEAMVVQAGRSVPACDRNIFVVLQDHIDQYGIDSVLESAFPKTSVIGITEVTQGQACTCEIAIGQFNLDLEKPICITACDNGVIYDETKYAELLNDPSVDCIVWSFRNNPTSVNNPNMYAWLSVDESVDESADESVDKLVDGRIRHVSVKKFISGDPLKQHAIIGTMFFRKAKYFMEGLAEIYEKNIRTNGEFYVDDLLNPLIERGLNVKVFESDFYVCWGTPDDYRTFLYWKKYFSKYGKTNL